MELENYVKTFAERGELNTLLQWIRWLRSKDAFHLGVLVGELATNLFGYNIDFLDELGMCYYYAGHYKQSWDLYMDILTSSTLSKERSQAYFFNAHFNIPHIENNFIDYNDKISKQIVFNRQPIPLITFSITTCKRFDLFEKTMNSFMNCCEDIHLITKWICVDDNSSEEDREKMKERYPFFKFIFKTADQKGHAESMNLILSNVTTPYLFHMEDDWKFFTPQPYIRHCLEVLNNNPEYGQCLINKNFAETFEDVCIVGGYFKTTRFGLRYWEHEYETNNELFVQRNGSGVNCAYWPHYSLRPSLNRVSMFKQVGSYKPEVAHFEMDYSYRYVQLGWKTTFLDGIFCLHIGRLTRERNDRSKPNAYILNGETQFVEKEIMLPIVMNLKRRKDRLEKFESHINEILTREPDMLKFKRFEAIDGLELVSNRYLEQLFRNNDYNYRSAMIGCALSHLLIWCEIVNSNVPSIAIVIEDDVTFTPYFTKKLQEIFKQLQQKEWDIIFLGHHIYNVTEKTYDKDLVPTCELWTTEKSLSHSKGGTHGYVINNRGASGMLKFIQATGMTNGIDTMMQKACDTLKVYYCEPQLIYSECYSLDNIDCDSDIQNNYSSLRRVDELKIIDEYNFFCKHSIPYIELDSFDNYNYDKVAIYNYDKVACPLRNGFSYTIGNRGFFIPNDMITGELKNYGLIYNGKFQTKHLITLQDFQRS